MLIHKVSHQQRPLLYQSSKLIKAQPEANIQTPDKTSVLISPKGKEAASVWQSVASRYDVTSISSNERVALSNELNEAGLMPIEAMIYMASPTSIDMDPNEKMNYLEIAKKSLEFERAAGMDRQQEIIREKAIKLM